MRTKARARTRCVLRCSTTFPATGRRVAQALGVVLAAAWPPGAAAAKGVFEGPATLSAAVSDWVDNEATAEATHGAISGWDTSRVDDMAVLFKDKTTFNAQLNWDTSKVTNMHRTFNGATAFNKPLAWDTSEVSDFDYMVTARASRLPAARTHPCTSASAHRRARPASSRATSPL